MTVIEAVAEKMTRLALEQQLEVLDFVEFIHNRPRRRGRRRNPAGLLADLPFDLTLDDFKAARREAWANFPREFPK